MERIIGKGIIYGFILGKAIAIIFIKHYEIINTSEGNEIYYLSKFDYFIVILKRGIVASLFGALLSIITFNLKDSFKLSKKMKFGAIIFGICIVGPVIQYLVTLRFNELLLFN